MTSGALISNLDQSSFQLWIDKKPTTIHSFGHKSNLPLTVLACIVDVDRASATRSTRNAKPAPRLLR